MTDLGDLLGLDRPRPAKRAQTRCADPTCGLPVYVDRLIFGFGECCAEKRGLIIHRYRIPARPQTGETLLDHLPERAPMTQTAPTADPAPRRRGIYVISEEQIHRALRLPDDQHVVALKVSFQRGALLVLAEGGNLPEVPVGYETPNVGDGCSYYPMQAGPAAQLDPGQLHTTILAVLDHVHLEDAAALAGRRSILERHAPEQRRVWRDPDPADPNDICILDAWCVLPGTDNGTAHVCRPCARGSGSLGPALWPCPDYRDASAGLIDWDRHDPDEEPATTGDTP